MLPNLSRYVWIHRRDTTRRAISLWKALQTQQWRRDSDEDLVEDYEGTILRVLEGIGIPLPENFVVAAPRIKRQADELSEKWVRLYNDRAAATTVKKG